VVLTSRAIQRRSPNLQCPISLARQRVQPHSLDRYGDRQTALRRQPVQPLPGTAHCALGDITPDLAKLDRCSANVVTDHCQQVSRGGFVVSSATSL
jgi:hypothetical protein